MKPKEKKDSERIVIRVRDYDLYRKLDDKRHNLQTTFQDVGLALFESWLVLNPEQWENYLSLFPLRYVQKDEGGASVVPLDVPETEQALRSAVNALNISTEEHRWVAMLLSILRSNSDHAVNGVRSNLELCARLAEQDESASSNEDQSGMDSQRNRVTERDEAAHRRTERDVPQQTRRTRQKGLPAGINY